MVNGRKTIKTIVVNEGKEDETVIFISTFDQSEIGICVSERQAGNAEIWLNNDQAKMVLTALSSALGSIENE